VGRSRPEGADTIAGVSTGASELDSGRELVAQACRVLAHRGLVEGVLGHVSLRHGDAMLLRCRGPHERGLRFTAAQDVRLIGLDGTPREEMDGYRPPNEWPIHGELLRLRPTVEAVVHAHPRAALIAGLAELPLRPVFGSFNIPALHMALDGVPIYPRPVLITRPQLARELAEAMGERPVCIMRGHGITVTGASVAAAVVAATNLDVLTSVTRELALLGAQPPELGPEDLAELPDLGSAFQDEMVWRALVAEAESDR
jgi:ribulose-5-phosphate 4-epimerase/fuculose-1-phosphate aldolase